MPPFPTPLKLLLASTLLLATAGCQEKKPPAPSPADYRVLDTFEVGENVYVRSLMVEPEKDALWVGTSVGVHEVGLTNRLVRQTFTREQGLANEYVFSIGKDAEGGIWFGTNAGGASRYKDGKWRTLFPMHGLADYWVYSFANHPDGSLWIGTWAGVNRLEPATGRMTTYVKELINEWVYAMGVDSKKRIWFGTEGGVSRFDGKQWVSWTHADGLGGGNEENAPASANTGLGTRNRHDLGVLSGGAPTYNPNYVFSLVVHPDDTIHAGTWGGGVSHFDGKKWRNATTKDGLPGNIVYSMVRDPFGNVWAGSNNGLGVWHQGKWSLFSDNIKLQGENIYTLAVTPQGEIWAGARGKVARIGLPGETARDGGQSGKGK
ncbi:MAG: regulator [Magnetococcales bacterium]|nr:regulator [Magnetococcales bacterium]